MSFDLTCSQPRPFRKRLACAAVFSALMSGCAQTVNVEADFPEPLVETLPLTVGLKYDEALSGYQYKEQVPNDVEWTFNLGAANLKLFDTVFGSLFSEAVPVADIATAAEQYPELDAVIAPEVEALEFSLPRQSQSDQYSVWIRYNLNVFDPSGDLITIWPVSAYGQSDTRVFGASGAMEQATIRAMRDAAASITLGFDQQPKIKDALLDDGRDESEQSESEPVADD